MYTQDQAAILLFIAVLIIVFYVLPIVIIMWKLFKKAGLPGWYEIIPVFNTYAIGIVAEKKKLGLATAIVYALSYVATRAHLMGIDVILSLAALVLGLILLFFFVRKYDAGVGKWLLIILFPYIGVFFVKNINFKSSLTGTETSQDSSIPKV